MFVHDLITNLLESLGYTKTEGCCHGVSLRWLEACLLGEENLFNERINTIAKDGAVLAHRFNAIKEKKGQYLAEQDDELLDILAFYDSLELYQSPRSHCSLFNASLSQVDVDLISKIASSGAIQSRGGLAQIYSEPGIYTKKEIKEYLDDLGVVLERACAKSKEPLGIILSSNNHTMALTYTPGEGWKFMDINQYPAKAFKISETDLLAEHIMTGFIQSNSPYSTFNVFVFTIANHLGLLNLEETFDSFKKSHPLTKELASREAEVIVLARIAAQYNHAPVIAELVQRGVDLNKVDVDGVMAYIAAQNGHVAVIAELAMHGMDLTKAKSNGFTPAYIAAQNGHVSVIAELAKYKVDLNQSVSNGFTLAYIAAQNGHASVIAELAKHQVDLNQAISDGTTPAFIAAQEGHALVIAELAKHQVDLNQAISDGTTPAFIAAQEGHALVIAELAIHHVDLNQAISNGATPAFIAAQEGHVAVMAELIKAGVTINIPYTASVDSFRTFAISYDEEVIERMNYFIDQQLEQSPTRQIISMTPDQIAVVMGHSEMMQLLNKHEEQSQKDQLNVSHELMDQTQSSHDKAVGVCHPFFSSSVRQGVAGNPAISEIAPMLIKKG